MLWLLILKIVEPPEPPIYVPDTLIHPSPLFRFEVVPSETTVVYLDLNKNCQSLEIRGINYPWKGFTCGFKSHNDAIIRRFYGDFNIGYRFKSSLLILQPGLRYRYSSSYGMYLLNPSLDVVRNLSGFHGEVLFFKEMYCYHIRLSNFTFMENNIFSLNLNIDIGNRVSLYTYGISFSKFYPLDMGIGLNLEDLTPQFCFSMDDGRLKAGFKIMDRLFFYDTMYLSHNVFPDTSFAMEYRLTEMEVGYRVKGISIGMVYRNPYTVSYSPFFIYNNIVSLNLIYLYNLRYLKNTLSIELKGYDERVPLVEVMDTVNLKPLQSICLGVVFNYRSGFSVDSLHIPSFFCFSSFLEYKYKDLSVKVYLYNIGDVAVVYHPEYPSLGRFVGLEIEYNISKGGDILIKRIKS